MPRSKKAIHRRRTRGEGTLYQKTRTWTTADGQTRSKTMWVAAVSEGVVADGDRQRRRRKFFYADTAEEARRARDAYRFAQTGKAPTPDRDEQTATTVEQYSRRFLRHAEAATRANTVRSYEQTLRLHVLPSIGHRHLAELSSDDIRALYAKLRDTTSASMVARVHTVLRAMLNLAVEERAIAASPLQTIRKAAPRVRRDRVNALSEKQVKALFKAAHGHRLEALFVLAVTTGMRQGELFALKWSDVDLSRRTIYVQRSAQEINGEITLISPKTENSARRISLSQVAVGALKARRALADGESHTSDLVFPSERGTVLRKSNFIRRVWEPIRAEAGTPNARFHDLRHTAASLLLAEGVNPKIVQEMLGHASIRLTLDTYSHMIPTMQAGAADAFDKLLG